MNEDDHTGLTVLSFGAGQDSTCILYKIIRDAAFRSRWVVGNLMVVFSDTGNEHPYTYRHIKYIQKLCMENRVHFVMIDPALGYHPNTWRSLTHQFTRNDSIMSIAFPRACTDNLKIKPIYNFIDHYIAQHYYGYTADIRPKGKTYIKRFAADNGKIRVIIGIAAGEERRISGSRRREQFSQQLSLFDRPEPSSNTWMTIAIDKLYPLVVEQLDRSGCQEYIRTTGWNMPYPSNCIFCPFISKIEVLWLYRNLPEKWAEWVQLEAAKINKHKNRKRNLGVKGEKLLPQILEEAISEYGFMTDEELDNYKMSHGHCVASKY